MFHQNNPLNSKDLGSSGKDFINSIKETSNSGLYNENKSKPLVPNKNNDQK